MKRVLITAGPTNEYIDEVMKITNMSTGRLGVELTKKYLNEGANVTLIATRSVFRSGLFERYNLSNNPNLAVHNMDIKLCIFGSRHPSFPVVLGADRGRRNRLGILVRKKNLKKQSQFTITL